MKFNELLEVLEFIEKNNSWENTLYRPDGDFSKPLIKYVRPHIDTRTNTVFSISLENRVFNLDLDKENALNEVYKYLNDKTYKSNIMTVVSR